MLNVCREVDELKGMFTDFENVQKQKNKNIHVFAEKDSLFDAVFAATDKIIVCVQQEIDRLQHKLKASEKAIEKHAKQFLQEISMET